MSAALVTGDRDARIVWRRRGNVWRAVRRLPSPPCEFCPRWGALGLSCHQCKRPAP